MRRFLLIMIFLISSPLHATVVPSWFNPSNVDFSFSGTLGRTDVDLVSNASGVDALSVYIAANGISAGKKWFAWMQTDQPNALALSAWDGIDLGVPREQYFVGKNQLNIDSNSSPLGPGQPAINGEVLADGGVHICIGSVTDPNCSYSNTSQPNPDVNYTFFMTFAPDVVSEPPAILLVLLGFAVMPLARFSLWRAKS